MPSTRRSYTDCGGWRFGVVVAVVLMVVLAGCGGSGGNQTPEPIKATASSATVSDGAVTSAGFKESAIEERSLSASGRLDVSGDVQMELRYNIQATTWRAIYHGPSGDGPVVFSVLSVPLTKPEQVSAVINPVADRSRTELASRAQDDYSEFGELSHVENRSVMVLGNETALAKYETTAMLDGGQVSVYLYVVRVQHAGDVVVGIGVFPQSADDPDAVRALVEGIQHES